MKAILIKTGESISVVKNDELDACYWVNSKTGEKYYKDEVNVINDKEEIQKYLDSLDKESLLSIIKYGLRGSDAPEGVTVDDIYECIGCQYIYENL